MNSTGKVTVLGINGHIGHAAAVAFAAAGWQVTGFGRSNKQPIAGTKFIRGDAESVIEMAAAIADADVVVNALNLPYHQWDNGRMEAQAERVIQAMGTSRKAMLFPGNIYNYAASQRLITPDAPQRPETQRGAIRVRTENLLKAAADRGAFQLIIIRAGDFYAPNNGMDWFDNAILREAGKGKVAEMAPHGIRHSWAYLPDLGRAFEKLAWHRGELGQVENFHFAGHFVDSAEMTAAIQAAAPVPLKVGAAPWGMIKVMGLAMPVMREVSKMRYLWRNTMELKDLRLDAILGADFGTPFQEAVRQVTMPFFEKAVAKAA
ncbi:MAG TPA: NAD-dependent epimerase/dehydratase family protein [Devosiaceae bacterium]|jgi:nucleoside-diphosphate-sugar epimerase